ncbi:MAG TPA: hypothetical protein VGW34_03160 [Allosphingosinicella sp.]|nr:hypothetical protein [Allosphingosinicella sp.]
MKLIAAAALAAAATAAALAAQSPVERQQRQVRQVVVYGTDPCPPSTATEIIVCARRPETERYRVPAETRDEPEPGDTANESWADRNRNAEEAGRVGAGTCEPVGPGHHTGCLKEMIDASRAEREAQEEAGPEL